MARDDLLRNRLLASIPDAELMHIAPHLVQVDLVRGQIVHDPGRVPRHVYFPTTSIVSLLYVSPQGTPTEIAIVGNDGFVSVAVFMSGQPTVHRGVVQCAGQAMRLDANVFLAEFRRGGSLQRVLLRYTQALMTQISQTAVCNHEHTLAQQLCRWLLLCIDRLPSNALSISEPMIAGMLGAERSRVVAALEELAAADVIRYGGGRIEVVDRAGLEARVCDCYRVVEREFARLLPVDPGV